MAVTLVTPFRPPLPGDLPFPLATPLPPLPLAVPLPGDNMNVGVRWDGKQLKRYT